MNAIKNEPELLVNDSEGIYIPQSFCKAYLPYIVNADELKEDIDICVAGPDHAEYFEAWDNLVDSILFTNDRGEKYTIGYLPESSDLWAIPEGYEFPEDNED